MQESRPKAPRAVLAGGFLLPVESPPGTGDLWIENRTIAAVSPPEPPPDWPEGSFRRIDARGLWILPGFVQTHVHLCQTLFRGAAEGRGLYRWLSEVIWPGEAALEPETIAVAAEAGIAQLLAGGTTTILDMGTTRHTATIAAVAARAGIRAILGPALMDRGPEPSRALLRTPAEFRREIDALAARFEGHDEGRLHVALCPRFAPSVTEPFLRELLDAPDLAGFPIHTHGSETREEVEEVRALTGRTPPAYFASFERAHGRLKMAHGVWLDEGDRTALKDSRFAVLHCPGSNLKLGSGLADTRALLERGIPVGLGADGAACNNRLDPWREMSLAALVQSLLHGPQQVSSARILEMATLGGARTLGMEERIGSLRAGKRADLVLLDPARDDSALRDGPDETGGWEDPLHESPETFLVFAGSAAMVRETWVDGHVLFRAGEGEEERLELSRRVRAARARLAERTGKAASGPAQ